jgi:hypothetical protein
MQDVFILEETTVIAPHDSYLLSYPHLVAFFASKTLLMPGDVVCGAHMVYGWMPTILDLYPRASNLDFAAAAQLLTDIKNSGKATDNELSKLAALVNNSLVGASKLLHFILPNTFPIWDSKVYTFVFEKKAYQNRISDITAYRKYQTILNQLQIDPRFNTFHRSMNNKIGYEVSPIRALELVMYLNAPTV